MSISISDLELGTCDNRGMHGPTQSQCESFYTNHNRSNVLEEVRVTDEIPYKGMQKWKVPHEGFYTYVQHLPPNSIDSLIIVINCRFIVKGASGGLGSTGVGSSRGAVAVAVLELHKNEELYLLVGQKGENACSKSAGSNEDACNLSSSASLNGNNGAGGGGGGSYVFLVS